MACVCVCDSADCARRGEHFRSVCRPIHYPCTADIRPLASLVPLAGACDDSAYAGPVWRVEVPAIRQKPLTPSNAALLELFDLELDELPGGDPPLLCLATEVKNLGSASAAAAHYAAMLPEAWPNRVVECRTMVVHPVRLATDTDEALQWATLYRAVGHPCFTVPTKTKGVYVVLASYAAAWCAALAAAPSGALIPTAEAMEALSAPCRLPLPAKPEFPPWFKECWRREPHVFVLRLAQALGRHYVRLVIANSTGYTGERYDVRLDKVADFIAAHPRALSWLSMPGDV